MCVYVCMHACMYVRMYVCMYVSMCVYVCTCVRVYVCMCIQEATAYSADPFEKQLCILGSACGEFWEVLGGLLGGSWVFRGLLVCLLGVLGFLGGLIWGHIGPKIAPRWARDCPRWPKGEPKIISRGPKTAPRWPKMAPRWPKMAPR